MKAKFGVVSGSGLLGALLAAACTFSPPATALTDAASVPPQLVEGFSSIVKAVTPAVVNIQVTQGGRVRSPRDQRCCDYEGPHVRPGPGPFGGTLPCPFGGLGGS